MENKQTEDLEKDIVSFEKAIELCTLGFDKQTLCGYDIADRQLYLCQVDEDGIYMPQKDLAAPTKSQVFRWFREKDDLHCRIEIGLSTYRYYAYIDQLLTIDNCIQHNIGQVYNAYEEAENACIDKLIELTK